MPRAFLVPDFQVVADENKVRDLIVTKGFDPVRTVLLEEAPRFPSGGKAFEHETDTVRFLDRGLNHLQLETASSGPRLLFLSETFYPGWRAWVDGRREKIYRANHAFRAIPLGPGRHTVYLAYQPFSFYLGLTISGLSLILLFLGLFLYKRSGSDRWSKSRENDSASLID